MEIKVVFSDWPSRDRLDRLDEFMHKEYLMTRWGKHVRKRKVHYYVSNVDDVANSDIQLRFDDDQVGF